jgi:hypothetical protein
MVDDAKLHQFMGQMLSDLGGAASVALVRIGDPRRTAFGDRISPMSSSTRRSR